MAPQSSAGLALSPRTGCDAFMKWLVRCSACLFLSLSTVHAQTWETFEKCSLLDKKYFDGDSFHVFTKKPGAKRGHPYVFRLYGVDCPETDTRHSDQMAEQKKEFGLTEEEVLAWGKKAKKFTADFLSKPFTVHTKKEDAGGESKEKRYYAVVVGASGERLDEALLKAGLTRLGKVAADWPKGTNPKHFRGQLHALQSQAKSKEAGIWGKR